MAKLVFAMNVSLDGYVDHDKFRPDAAVFRHWTEAERALTGSILGRRIYEIMQYWDEDQPEWDDGDHEFASVWRQQKKWVVSRTLTSVGPGATLIGADVEAAIQRVKAEHEGEIAITGPALAGSVASLIDEYRLYLHPVVLGSGAPFFTGPIPPLRLLASERIGADVIRLSYVPA